MLLLTSPWDTLRTCAAISEFSGIKHRLALSTKGMKQSIKTLKSTRRKFFTPWFYNTKSSSNTMVLKQKDWIALKSWNICLKSGTMGCKSGKDFKEMGRFALITIVSSEEQMVKVMKSKTKMTVESTVSL